MWYRIRNSLNTMSETIFSNSLISQEFAKLKYTLNLKISKSHNLANAKISRPKVKHFVEKLHNGHPFMIHSSHL